MANLALPIEERNLTPSQVASLDKRRNRGFVLMVIIRAVLDHRHHFCCSGSIRTSPMLPVGPTQFSIISCFRWVSPASRD